MASIKAIYIASGSGVPMQAIEQADLMAGQGIVGDRYYTDSGTFSGKLKDLPDKELTLIESEQIDLFNAARGFKLDYGAFRRNVVTAGVHLEDLIGRKFTIGRTTLQGIRQCEPCAHLAGLLGHAVLSDMVHKAGLRAAILTSGKISPGDAIIVHSR